MNPNDTERVNHITREEALSEHVEDMLKRQIDFARDPGVTREPAAKLVLPELVCLRHRRDARRPRRLGDHGTFSDDLPLLFQGTISAVSQSELYLPGTFQVKRRRF